MTRTSHSLRLIAALLVLGATACQSDDRGSAKDPLLVEAKPVQSTSAYNLDDGGLALVTGPDQLAAPPVEPPPVPEPTPPVPAPKPEPVPEPKPEPTPEAVLASAEPAAELAPVPTAKAGTNFTVQVTTRISSRISRVGDVVTGRVESDLTDENGQVIIPAGSRVMGKISELRTPDALGRDARIEVTFSSIVVNGESHPIDAVTQNLPVEVTQSGSNGPGTAARAGRGAIIGGILGGLFGGNTRGAAIGVGAGAAVGALSKGGGGQFFEVALSSSNVACVLNSPFSIAAVNRAF